MRPLDIKYSPLQNISFNDEPPKFSSLILTNDKGIRTYIYHIKFFEKFSLSELDVHKTNLRTSNSNLEVRNSNNNINNRSLFLKEM